MFDTLLNDVATRFGITTEKAKQLLGLLIALIFNEKRGGAAGFADLFRSRGMGDAVASWIGDGPNQPIDANQLEQVLGANEVDTIARQTGVERGLTASALAAMLPGAFNTLTEDGRIPVGIPERVRGFMDGLGDFFRSIGVGALGLGAAAVGGVANAAHRAGDAIGDAGRATVHGVDRGIDSTVATTREVARETSSGIGKLLPWLLIGAVVIGALLFFKGCRKDEAVAPAAAPVATTTTPAAATPAASANPRFAFGNHAGKVAVSGQLASDAEKARLMDALRTTFGTGNVNGDITVDATTAPAGWLDRLIALLPSLKAQGLKFDFDGNTLKFDTSAMSMADRNALMEKLDGAFDNVRILGLDAGTDALAALKDGFGGDELVKALSMVNIQFRTGSADISPSSLVLVRNAADYIKKAPAGTRIEVGGHTDNVGNAASNLKLSEARANAVMAKLKEFGVADGVLSAKGYGDSKPVADNGSEEGRAKNRRIEYTLAQ